MTGSSFHLSAGMRGPDLPHACAGGEEHAAWPGSHAAHAPAHECPLCGRPKAALGTARSRSCTRTLARSLARRPARMHEVADSRRVLLCERYILFFWKAYLSIKQHLTAHGPIHPRVSSRHERYIHRANARACARAVRATE